MGTYSQPVNYDPLPFSPIMSLVDGVRDFVSQHWAITFLASFVLFQLSTLLHRLYFTPLYNIPGPLNGLF